MKTHKSAPRGQALVETALGIIVVGAVFVASIHFAEIGFVSLKVQEAAAAGLWASTGGARMHHWPKNDPEPFDCMSSACGAPPLVATASAAVQDRYQDFDGLTSVTLGGTSRGMYIDASNMQVRCQMGAAPLAGRGATQGGNGGLVINPVYDDNGGLSCTAQATVNTSAIFPVEFFEVGTPGGNFGTNIGVMKANNMPVCGFGRPSGGTCQGRYEMMVDDWAGQDIQESGVCLIAQNPATATACSLPGVRNTRFQEAAQRMFDAVNVPFPGMGSVEAMWVVGWSPISLLWPAQDEGVFFMSSSGESVGFIQPPPIMYPNWQHFRVAGIGTTPGGPPPISFNAQYFTSYLSRDRCFLGKSCN